MKKLILPVILLGAIACVEEPEMETEATQVEAITETDTAIETEARSDWWAYEDFDADANQQVSRAEFASRWETGFTDWDVDGDGALGPDESADTFWDFFDGNDDNIIDENEWSEGVARWDFDGVEWGEWNTWNADEDNELTESEWRQAWNDNVWNAWDSDGDGAVARDEVADTFWDFFDGNDDDIIDADEWRAQG